MPIRSCCISTPPWPRRSDASYPSGHARRWPRRRLRAPRSEQCAADLPFKMRDAAARIANNDRVGDVHRPDRQMLVSDPGIAHCSELCLAQQDWKRRANSGPTHLHDLMHAADDYGRAAIAIGDDRPHEPSAGSSAIVVVEHLHASQLYPKTAVTNDGHRNRLHTALCTSAAKAARGESSGDSVSERCSADWQCRRSAGTRRVPTAALSGPIPKAPGFAGGYLPHFYAVGLSSFAHPNNFQFPLTRTNNRILSRGAQRGR